MTIYDAIPVKGITPEMVKTLLKQAGFDATELEANLETLNMILTAIKESGKYNTVADILADEEFMKSVVDLTSKMLNGGTQEPGQGQAESVHLQLDSVICCKKCGHMMTLRQFKGV